MAAEKTLANFTTATNDEKRQEQHRIHQFFSSLLEVWIQLCDSCEFVADPVGFERLKGMTPQIRHKMIQLLNPGVLLETTTLKIKLPQMYQRFYIDFDYSCLACGKLPERQRLTITQAPRLQPS
jgi:hypothetical protein